MDDDYVSIGRFARLTGLSVHTLRHYDEVALLVPSRVDTATGFRYYSLGLLPRARRIKALRWTNLPVDEVRTVLDEPARAHDILTGHRARLEREGSANKAALDDIDHLLDRPELAEDGESVSTAVAAVRPVQIKLLVSDLDAAAAFYADAFGFDYQVTQRTADEDFSGFMFGRWGATDFFLVHLQTSDFLGAAGPATIGLTVPNLDVAHERATSAGATEIISPHDTEGMPRSSAVRDPDDNVVWLYQS